MIRFTNRHFTSPRFTNPVHSSPVCKIQYITLDFLFSPGLHNDNEVDDREESDYNSDFEDD